MGLGWDGTMGPESRSCSVPLGQACIQKSWQINKLINGSYTMTANIIRALKLHYPMNQFLIKININRCALRVVLAFDI